MRQFKNTFLLFFLFLFLGKISAQNIAINKTGASANASAILDLQSTDQGLLTPRMTSAQRTAISNPANGLLIFDTNTNSFWFYESSAWAELNSGETTLIADTDGNTKVQVEESANENNIRFDIDGAEEMVLTSEGKLGLGTTPAGFFHVQTDPSASQEVTAASVTASNTGLYGTTSVYQSFTSAEAGTLSSFAIKTNGNGSSSGTINVYSGNGTGGSLLGGKAYSYSNVTNTWATIALDDLGIDISIGSQYTIQFAISTGQISHIANSNNPHAGGNYYSNPYGVLTGYDMLFQVKVGSPAQPAHDIIITDEGRVGIRTTNPAYSLHVNGTVAGTSAYTNLSDQRYKKDIQTVENALEKIMKIEGVSFDWRQSEFPDLNFSKGREIGFIAQNLKPVFPEIVNQDEAGFHSVEYANLVPVLVEAVKELSQKLEMAQKQIDEQSTQLTVQGKELRKIIEDQSGDESAFFFKTKNGNNE